MNSKELNDGTMALGTQFKYMCKPLGQSRLQQTANVQLTLCILVSLSSVVIVSSLAFAFGSWARTAVSVGIRVVYAYLAYWLGMHKIKVKRIQGTAKLKELEKGTDFDLQRRELLRRLAEINDASEEQERKGLDRRSSWRRMVGRGVNGRPSQRATAFELGIP
jgi:hypothetical protein